MNATPTLQSLAVEARDAFGEDDTPQTDPSPTSFDVVVEVYVREGNRETGDEVVARACAALTSALTVAGKGSSRARPAVRRFVSMSLHFLRVQYPNCADLKRDQRLLS